jgi:hypothetical protein
LSEASNFQSGVSRGRLIASSGRLARVLQRLHRPLASPAPIEALPNGRGRLGGPAVAFHAERPRLGLGAVGVPDCLLGSLPGALGAHLRTHDPARFR